MGRAGNSGREGATGRLQPVLGLHSSLHVRYLGEDNTFETELSCALCNFIVSSHEFCRVLLAALNSPLLTLIVSGLVLCLDC